MLQNNQAKTLKAIVKYLLMLNPNASSLKYMSLAVGAWLCNTVYVYFDYPNRFFWLGCIQHPNHLYSQFDSSTFMRGHLFCKFPMWHFFGTPCSFSLNIYELCHPSIAKCLWMIVLCYYCWGYTHDWDQLSVSDHHLIMWPEQLAAGQPRKLHCPMSAVIS